jgi:acyl-CoA thioester hydrolase
MRWADMDALGHVNNTVYFRYMEQARIEWLYALAHKVGFYDRGQGPVIVNASCNFPVPLVYPGDVARCRCSSATRAARRAS